MIQDAVEDRKWNELQAILREERIEAESHKFLLYRVSKYRWAVLRLDTHQQPTRYVNKCVRIAVHTYGPDTKERCEIFINDAIK